MKKIIITILLLFFCIDVYAATRTISTSSSRISRPSTTTTTIKPRVIKSISTSTKPITNQNTTTYTPIHTTTQTITHYQYKQNNDNTSSLLYGVGGGIVGSIAGNMIYDALTPDQSIGNTVSDGGKTYNEILNSSGVVVGYKPQEEETSNGFMIAITIINTLLGVGLLSALFLLFKR